MKTNKRILTLASCVSLVALCTTSALAQSAMPDGFSLPAGNEMRSDGSAVLPDGRELQPVEAQTGLDFTIVDISYLPEQWDSEDELAQWYSENVEWSSERRFLASYGFGSTEIETRTGADGYGSTPEEAENDARQQCLERYDGETVPACRLVFKAEFVAVEAGAEATGSAGIVNAGTPLDSTRSYPPMRLLAYSINDGQRAQGGELTGYFVAPVDGAGGIVEGEENAPVLQMFATGQDTVMFATGMESAEGPRFLVATEDGATFAATPEESSYFLIRQPLEASAAAQGFISLESQQFPGQFLRHAGFRLMLDPIDANSESLARRDATFVALAEGADIPRIGGSDDVLTQMVTAFGGTEQVTVQSAIYEALETNFFAMERTETVEVSLVVSIITSLYEVREEVVTQAVLTLFADQNVTSVSDTISVAAMVETVQTGVAAASGFHLASHFAAMGSVDMAACGVEEGGFGGFGKREVPTNSHGDVHIFTPDGLTYDFQDGGEFTLLASADGRFEVHTRQTVHTDDTSVSSNTAVAIRMGTSIVEFYSDEQGQRLYVNGESNPLPETDFDLAEGGYVRFDGHGKSGPRYLIGWPGENGEDEFTVRVNLYQAFLNVGVAGAEGTYSGLIGNLDGNPLNDMLPRDGSALLCPPANADFLAWFGDSWRLASSETLLRAELDESLVAIATEAATGRRVNVEAAVVGILETSFASYEASQSVDISVIISSVTELYNVSEEVVLDVVINLFEERGITSVTDTINVSTITEFVQVYKEQREVRSIETLDVTVRANAQRICEANGISDQLALANCTLDVAATQDETFVESAASFQEVIVEVSSEQRQTGSSVSNPLAPEAILPAEQVIEIVGEPEIVPSFEQLTQVVQSVSETTTTLEQRVVTQVTTDIKSTVDMGACSEVEGLQSPAAVLEEQPTAGGVAIYCATHARGQTVTVELGRTLDEAIARAEQSCSAEASSRVEDFGDVVIGCREIGRAEREFDFGGGVLALGREVQVTLTERRIEKAELLERIENFSLVLSPVPGLTAQCLGDASVPIEGLTVDDGLLSYTGEGETDFQNLCGDISLKETEDDYLLQAVCFNEDASDAPTSAISLLGTAAVEALVSHPECAPAPVAEGPFTVFAEDGLEAAFPDRGDFVLIRTVGWESFGTDESSDPGIIVNARRDLWTADSSESVFTALFLRIGVDTLEVRATPEPAILVNGLPFEDAIEQNGEEAVLPGGGRIRIEGGETSTGALVFMWPDTAFALRVTMHPGSHISPAIQIDEAFEYEGLARFTQDWTLTQEEAGFSMSLGDDPTCDCGNTTAE